MDDPAADELMGRRPGASEEPARASGGPPLFDDPEHAAACHRRWSASIARSNDPADPAWEDGLGSAQCGWCRYAIPLQGALRSDWGVCSNPASPHDGRVVFEHDGCAAFADAGEWVIG